LSLAQVNVPGVEVVGRRVLVRARAALDGELDLLDRGNVRGVRGGVRVLANILAGIHFDPRTGAGWAGLVGSGAAVLLLALALGAATEGMSATTERDER